MNILRPASLLALSLISLLHASRAAPLDYSVSWLGNSFGGSPHWVQQDIAALHVTPDGTVYTNIPWDEGGRNVGVYKEGRAIGDARHTHGWGYQGGRAITVNSKYVFIAQQMENEGGGLKGEGSWPPKGFSWQGISRRLRSDIQKGAPFENGKGGEGDTLLKAFLPIAQPPDGSKLSISGLCATEDRVFVTDPLAKSVKIYDTESMALLASWPLESQGPMLVDKAQTLWILQAAGVPRIARYSFDGKKLEPQIRFALGVTPVAMCLDNRGRMLVADDGLAQQVLVFDRIATNPRLVGTLGQKGGIRAGRVGAFGDWKLNHPHALGCDARGNVYIAHGDSSGGGSTVLESYAPSGRLNWRLLGLEFVDMADQDMASGDIFTKEERFRFDASKPRGGEASYAAYTIDRVRFPQDPRLHIWSAGAWVRRVSGRKLLFVNDMNAEYLQVYRFEDSSETAIPCALFSPRHIDDKGGQAWPPSQPARGEWAWSDKNGNGAFDAGEFTSNGGQDASYSQGWWVDEAGNVWLASEREGIRMFPLRGLSARGIPSWDFSRPRAFAKPAELDQVKRLRYDSKSDVLYLGGTTVEHRNQHWKPMGAVICRYDNWLRGARALKWKIVAPYAKGSSGHESCEPMGFDVAEDLIFVPYTGASKEIGFSTGHIEVFRAEDGASLGSMKPPSDIGEIGLQDIRECLTVRRQANGDYLVFLEEDYKSKILMYRLKATAGP